MRAIADVRMRALGLLWFAAALQIVLTLTGTAVSLVPVGIVAVWIVANVGGRPPLVRGGLLLLLAGLVGNGTAIAANGRMPYSAAAAGLMWPRGQNIEEAGQPCSTGSAAATSSLPSPSERSPRCSSVPGRPSTPADPAGAG